MSPKSSSWNPFLFKPVSVTFFTALVYVGLVVGLLIVHIVVPSAPTSPTPINGINVTEAWLDLQELTNGFHPYNSRRNDEVRDWLLKRIDAILSSNKVDYSTVDQYVKTSPVRPQAHGQDVTTAAAASSAVIVWNDMLSNVTFSAPGAISGSAREPGISVYFEGTNIIVYVRGSEDPEGDWWNRPAEDIGSSGILVNAHYDSVSTGYGATDDGVGVVTVLQLLQYFTTPGNAPKKGVIALLNNGEEDFLNGARAFTQSPVSQFAHAFLNLEGAGAGGRATLFRSTDTEVTRFYKKSPYPFGSALSGDGFKRGLIRSQTDYVVFDDILGLRGLDVAFMEPRARYHTDLDDARHTGIDSVWHMLSASVATMKALTSDTSPNFEGSKEDAEPGKVSSGKRSEGVWFDMFGRAFAVFRLQSFFAISVTLLVASPVFLLVVALILRRVDKMYLFSKKTYLHSSDDDEPIKLYGWRGVFRDPVAFVLASAAAVGLSFLVTKLNPYIVYSSPFAVWSMMLTAWFVVAWFIVRGADFVRPSALHRLYSLVWTYIGAWVLLVGVTVLEHKYKIAGGYFIVFYLFAAFLALLISFLELFGLERKSVYAARISDDRTATPGSAHSDSASARLIAPSSDENPAASGENEDSGRQSEDNEPTERTPLFRNAGQTSFANYSRARGSGRRHSSSSDQDDSHGIVSRLHYGEEQAWSAHLPQWTWLLQFILTAPIVIILVGQIGLLITSALHQTLADGSSALLVYILIAVFSILLLVPLTPYLHRYTYHIPTFLFFIFVGTLLYNLIAFPFSPANRLKVFFQQAVDLETGINRATLTGLEPYVQGIIHQIPSAAGQDVSCVESSSKLGLVTCSWDSLAPQVVPNLDDLVPPGSPPEIGYAEWLTYNVSRVTDLPNTARFTLVGRNTRSCRLLFDSPITDVRVHGAGSDPYDRFDRVPAEGGTKEIRLWSREWERPWTVDVNWQDSGDGRGLDGHVVCIWSDDNDPSAIPALEEIRRFAPDWVAITKLADGLVEGRKAFMV
ncbi:putative zinc metalloprotease [Xylona heveae TC161]|uniref:Peptide hydrolase n=1 Tax=Xylona heveae (strain CBS 132557 / TC161) TaxID=1328760 RepID=A0A165GGC0_XYLHT|nr:putative zinc metalloprotease [Xylona heveae TC161]KZF22150.1 putative zinc metalloprotease [Xylona heveae TC161]